jgi:capsular polysaccharide export protein
MSIEQARAAWWFRKVLRHPLLPGLLEESAADPRSVHVGWGMRPSGRAARQAARSSGGRLLLLEDSFVRSLRPGTCGPVYGLIADSLGIHYLSDGSSDLIHALNTGSPFGWMRAQPYPGEDPDVLLEKFRACGVSKYNWFPGEYEPKMRDLPEGILVVDQTRGDASLRHGALSAADFERMLRAALDECEGAPVYVRGHPDHVMRGKSSCLPERLLRDARIRFLPPAMSPAQCFSFCHTVLCAGSLMGMEALIHGRKVVTFGWPFFAGWGLTDDRAHAPKPPRKRSISLRELFDFAYLRYGHYFDPDLGTPCGLGEIIDHIARQKDMYWKNAGHRVTVGFSPWKKRIADAYFRSPAGRVTHAPDLPAACADGTADHILLWGRKQDVPSGRTNACARVEDGFLRSKGLGAAFNFPYSWVVDHSGIYFDSTGPSDLESILNRGAFTEAQRAQSRDLIRLLCEKRLTKYNLACLPVALDPQLVRGRKVILVPGQVELDMSIAYGSPVVKTNLDLLRRVRAEQPDACIVFKAHPDLVAGVRHGSLLPPAYDTLCDLAVTDGNVLDWMDLCDEIHTMTSTVGFEAILRGVPVITYGMPFYAGWGLTCDKLACPRRTRVLTVEELVCGALLAYPRYLNPATGEFTTAPKVARLLTSPAAAGDRRVWYLKAVSALKRRWVELARR